MESIREAGSLAARTGVSASGLNVTLNFHGVGRPGRGLEPGEALYWVSVDQFRRFLDLAVEHPGTGITFDDGNASDFTALPELQERGLSATFFPITGRLGRRGSLQADEVRALAEAGMAIGSHGLRHRNWRSVHGEERRAELVGSRRILSEVAGRPVEWAACPFGAYDRGVLSDLRRLGYTRVFTVDRSPNPDPDSWLQHRYCVRATDTPELLRAEAFMPRPLSQRVRGSAVRFAKRMRP